MMQGPTNKQLSDAALVEYIKLVAELPNNYEIPQEGLFQIAFALGAKCGIDTTSLYILANRLHNI